MFSFSGEPDSWNSIFGREAYFCHWYQHTLTNCPVTLPKKTNPNLRWKWNGSMKTCAAQIQQTERTVHIHSQRGQPQLCYDSVFSETCSAEWKNIPWWFLTVLFPQIVHILLNSLDSNCTPDLLIPAYFPTGNDCFWFFSTSFLTASTEILFPCRLWTQQWQSCAVSWSVGHTRVVSGSSS